MNQLFETRPLGIGQGLLVIAIGAAGFAVVEAEKALRRRVGWTAA